MEKEHPLERREILVARLTEGQSLSATALAEEFGVSPDAIRRDLRTLAAEGICRRVYGGALPLSPASSSMQIRSEEAPSRKAALASASLALIPHRAFLFLDSGSTNLALARVLPSRDLAVATNSVEIGAVLAGRRDLRLHMVGGVVDPEIGGCVDVEAVRSLEQINIDLTFLGACSISAAEGVSAFHVADAAFKRAVLLRSRRVALMTTSEKLATRAPYRVAPLEAIDTLVIEHDAVGHPEIDDIRALGIDIQTTDHSE